MRYGSLMRQARARVRRLDEAIGIPRPLDVEVLLDRLEQHRGRSIHLHESDRTAGGPCGLWLQQADRDVIVYAADTSPVHQDHIILHEIGHMIAEHGSGCALAIGAARELAPSASPTLIAHIFARSNCSTLEELEAEMIASFIWLAAAGRDPARERTATTSALAWMEQTFDT